MKLRDRLFIIVLICWSMSMCWYAITQASNLVITYPSGGGTGQVPYGNLAGWNTPQYSVNCTNATALTSAHCAQCHSVRLIKILGAPVVYLGTTAENVLFMTTSNGNMTNIANTLLQLQAQGRLWGTGTDSITFRTRISTIGGTDTGGVVWSSVTIVPNPVVAYLGWQINCMLTLLTIGNQTASGDCMVTGGGIVAGGWNTVQVDPTNGLKVVLTSQHTILNATNEVDIHAGSLTKATQQN
jgi:hypothetical protein